MSNTYNLMQTDKPYKSYIKRSLAKLYVTILNPFSGELTGVILHGDPRNPSPDCIIEVWSEKEDVYLRRANKKHFDTGELIEYKPKDEPIPEEIRLNQLSDDELHKILNDRFLVLKNYVDKVTSVTTLFTLLSLAEEEEKSEKIINFIKAKIENLQQKEFAVKEE